MSIKSAPDRRDDGVGQLLAVEVELARVGLEPPVGKELTLELLVLPDLGAFVGTHRKVADPASRTLIRHRIVASEANRTRRVQRTERQRLLRRVEML
jgi:hypothetical protein